MAGRKDQIKFVDIPDSFTTDAAVMTNGQLSQKYDRSEPQIVRWRRVVKVPSPPVMPGPLPASRYTFPDPRAKNYKEAGVLLIEGDCVVSSDWHVPYHDVELAERLVRVAEKQKIRQLAIVGDLFDAATLSIFDPQDVEFGVKEELNATTETLKHLLKFFDRIYWSLGNHEVRLLRMLKFQVDLVDMSKWLIDNPKIITTPLTYMVLDSNGERFRLTHPRSYSRIAMRVAQALAVKFQCHVMSAHGHLFGLSMDPSNRYRCIDTGGLFDESRLVYKNVGGDTTHPCAVSGFWVVKQGVTIPYGDTVTHWPTVLGKVG